MSLPCSIKFGVSKNRIEGTDSPAKTCASVYCRDAGSGYNINGLWLERGRENHKFWVLPACMGLTNFAKGNGARFNRTNMEVIIDNHVAFSVLARMKMHAGKEGGI
jgi:hypothetical protein